MMKPIKRSMCYYYYGFFPGDSFQYHGTTWEPYKRES